MKKISILIGLLLCALTTAHDCGWIHDEEHHYQFTIGYQPELIINHDHVKYRGGYLKYKSKITDKWECWPTFHAPVQDDWHRLDVNYPEGGLWGTMFFKIVPFD